MYSDYIDALLCIQSVVCVSVNPFYDAQSYLDFTAAVLSKCVIPVPFFKISKHLAGSQH